MARALIAACAADGGARLELKAQRFRIARTRPREQAPGHFTDVGTVEVQTNALDHGSDIILGQARIGACRAHGAALIARLYTGPRNIAVGMGGGRMTVEHRLELIH
ncbi:MAG: hypothetical protein ACREK1_06080 [Longimicrobiales bacterium]